MKSRSALSIVVAAILCSPIPSFAQSLPAKSPDIIQKHQLKYDRIIITGNCPFGLLLTNKEAYKHIIGTGPWSFNHADMNLLRDMYPDIDRITTNFINTDYKVNMESLMDLNPDVIYYYGTSQNDHLDRSGVPTINLDPGGATKSEPKETQVYWENTYDKTLGLPPSHKFENAWDKTLKQVKPFADKIKKQHIRALYLEDSGDKVISVSGPKTFGDSYLKMAGLENVASDLKVTGDAGRYIDVSMEQILQWNPDVIFVVFGSAKNILNNKYPGQDWNDLKAVQEGKVYNTPVGVHNWGGLSAETPMLPIYLINKINPNFISDKQLKDETREYYKTMFDYNIPDNLLNEVLAQK